MPFRYATGSAMGASLQALGKWVGATRIRCVNANVMEYNRAAAHCDEIAGVAGAGEVSKWWSYLHWPSPGWPSQIRYPLPLDLISQPLASALRLDEGKPRE